MDAARFDALTRSLAMSRRTTRKTFLGAGLGLLLAGRRRDAAADCKKVGRGCNGDNDCCKARSAQWESASARAASRTAAANAKTSTPTATTAARATTTAAAGSLLQWRLRRLTSRATPTTAEGVATSVVGSAATYRASPRNAMDRGVVVTGSASRMCRQTTTIAGRATTPAGEGETCCAGACLDLAIFSIDPANCGTCGHTCGESDPNCVGFCTGDGDARAGTDPCEDELRRLR